MASLEDVRAILRKHNQEDLLAFYGELAEPDQARLLDQIASIDFAQLDGLIRTHVRANPSSAVPTDLAPPVVWPAQPKDAAGIARHAAARKLGEELIAGGKVAALTVAGGDGTRLGFAGPKGCLPVTPIRRKCLFQVFAESLLATGRRFGRAIPWYLMTSPYNDAATREAFAESDYFGLQKEDVFFFIQGQMPAVGLDGKILLADKGRIAFNPDGHGGSLGALARSGALADMARRGVDYISYFQVDNPLVRCIDPLFIGLHAAEGAQMSAKGLPKRDPMEKLGNFCLHQGKVLVIEYSDMPEELANATGPDGRLKFWAGSIAIHVLSRSYVEKLTAGGDFRLPFHRALKKVPSVGPTGARVVPESPNAVKLETFVFDAMLLADKAVILETARSEEFSPVKNAAGPDSLTTCLHDQVRRAAKWLERAGVRVPRDADGQVAVAIEISPLLAMSAEELVGKVASDLTIKPGSPVYLE
jgi:UDP-N-acetylglucosamine/UDP-N-acetylgalactosamine diphosphorylase